MSAYYGWPPNATASPTCTDGGGGTYTQILTGTTVSTTTLTMIGTGGGGGCAGGYTTMFPNTWPGTIFTPAKVDLTQVSSEELMDEVLRRGVFKSIKEYRDKKQKTA